MISGGFGPSAFSANRFGPELSGGQSAPVNLLIRDIARLQGRGMAGCPPVKRRRNILWSRDGPSIAGIILIGLRRKLEWILTWIFHIRPWRENFGLKLERWEGP